MGKSVQSTSRSSKVSRLDLRASAAQKRILEEAARLKHTSVTEFILQTACEAAKEVLAEEGQIRMPKDDWKAFLKALDAPPRSLPALRKLLTTPGVFDGQ